MSDMAPRLYTFFFSCSAQLLRIKFILLTTVKMPTILGILTFISGIITCIEAKNSINLGYFSINGRLKFHAQQS